MAQSSTNEACCTAQNSDASRYNVLTRISSSNVSTRILANLAAASLVTASAGFGAVYAWSNGIELGLPLAVLSVLMALGLELAKPFSIAAAFSAIRNWRPIQGVALALLGLVAVSYSLTAELSLFATTRGDIVAERAALSNVAIKARERYERANLELTGISAARSSAELQALINGVLANPKAGGCIVIDGPFTRDNCPKVAEWKAEQGRAEHRAKLETTMREAERDMVTAGPVQRQADPGANALSAYLGIFGLKVEPGLLTELLILVGVLALEIGSALSLVLVQAVSGVSATRVTAKSKSDAENTPVSNAGPQVVHPRNIESPEEMAHVREKVKTAIVNQLKKSGGSTSSSERGLAKLIGTSRPTVRRAVNGLVLAGVLAAEATRNGTMLRLVS